ncbi:MAG: imidazole glycerol phosphate synthase, glutamine amidotransferase subunit [Nitrospirae bacterium RIFCSPLOW2_12_42_9]|nr:MAG: imidazole glycerol phosphate synthase, glutamine amidotransferase subunit [Nitrospirae bacterium RIFCSPLOWO2_02_42_7]OGW56583.1 MAG: imidazole glycerol phosphate synthase, glutamine amidotransferase subunit [Nitrospirae bacterium RIFCSPLOW2_12_42_9]
MSLIAIIDYGMGNLRSVEKAFEYVGHRAFVAKHPTDVSDASHVVLPGVGGFPECMKNLENTGMIDAVYKSIESGKQFLGICLGLQLLFSESEEFGCHNGLNILEGRVVRFTPGHEFKVPHMGWNQIMIKREVPLLKGIPDNSFVYFVHSYYVIPSDKEIISTQSDYGGEFVSSVWKDNIFACQFHPEKSQEIGLRILKNFGDIK